MLIARRIHVPASGFAADANILPRHPADAASWIWHPNYAAGTTAFLRFHLDFNIAAPITLLAHVTGDQRFQLTIDDREIGFGPDRCDLDAWTVQSYEITLAAGTHRIETLVWWLADETLANASDKLKPPVAQSTWRGGFLFAAENEFASLLNTGCAPWHVTDLTHAVRPVAVPFHAYHDIGPEFHIDGAAWTATSADILAKVIAQSIIGNPHGVRRPGWRLEPSALPEQKRERVTKGRVRKVEADAPAAFQNLLVHNTPLTIPPHTRITALWDFEDYICGYARLATDGGAGARVRIEWAEALHTGFTATQKGDRNETDNKHFTGFGDEYFPSTGTVAFPAFWWRSGRYLRITITTSDTPLTLHSLEIVSTGYPLGEAAAFRSDNTALDRALPNAIRTLRACAHELWVDCPYYEQMAYVGDSRLTALTGYALFADDRLSRRMIELFDRSRSADGFVSERVPCGAWHQTSITYSLLWVLMVRDFAWWRDDETFVRACLPGIRAMLENIHALCDRDGMLANTPGWPFVDWVPEWDQGCGPGVREGDSSIVNLHWLLALRAASEIETAFDEPEMAALHNRRANRLAAGIVARYWSAADNLLRDTRDTAAPFSEHAQALGILAKIEPPCGLPKWTDSWLSRNDLARATVYFSFYILEALRLTRREDVLKNRIQNWCALANASSLLTLPESPEPTRSDCHGWGAHVRWHASATIAGVRPSAPAFSKVIIEPLAADYNNLHCETHHPRGIILLTMKRDGKRTHLQVTLPDGVTGELRMNGKTSLLHAGLNHMEH